MKHLTHWMIAAALSMAGFTGRALADDQQDVWKLEQQQWKLAAAKDTSWIETMVHPNLRMWETGAPMPRDRASLQRWARYDNSNGTILEYELQPISTTITGNVAVVQYYYMMARENDKKERERATGHYTDILIKEGGQWLFIAWAGGDDPKK